MRDYLKILVIILIGLIIAVMVYPFLHETGHFIAAKMVSSEVVTFNIFPQAYVECNILNVTKTGVFAIGIAGNLIPSIIVIAASIIRVNKFNLWYVRFYVTFVCWLSYVISIISVIATAFIKETNTQDDLVRVVQLYPDTITIGCVFSLIMVIILTLLIIKDRPIKRFKAYAYD